MHLPVRLHRMTTAGLAAVAVAMAIAGPIRPAAGQPAKPPNILLLYVDDLRYDGLGATGHDFVQTPNIDQRIAGRGMNLVNSFATCPLCSPSRASLMTGQYPETHGLDRNDQVNAVPDERLPIYQKTLQSAGYRTGLVGKWHMDSYFEPRAGFNYWAAFQGQGTHTNPQLRVKQDATAVRTVNETGYTTTILTNYALDFLKDYGTGGSRTEPFALTLSFKAVHGPHGDQYTQSGGLYAGETIDRPPSALATYGGLDINAEKPAFSRPGYGGLHPNDTMGNSQQISQMEMLHDIDTNIGRVLDALEAKGLDNNTLVIFTSDNGFFWGEHGRGDKRLAYEESIRVPLLVRGPGIQPGQTSDALVTNIDLAPTILKAAGLGIPGTMQGKPLNGVLSGSAGPTRDAVFASYRQELKYPEIPSWDAVRSQSHLYLTYPDLGSSYDELYDLAADPYQMNNLLRPGPINALPIGTQQALDTVQTQLHQLRREATSVNPFTRQIIPGSATDFTLTEGGVVRSDTDMRVGAVVPLTGTDAGRSAILAYELPRLDDPSLLERAFVSFHIVRQTGNVSTVHADLWAIGITETATPLTEYLEADAEKNLANRADNVKLQDNIITSGQHLARTFSNDKASVVLADYLRTFYEAHPDYAGGSFLQVRLNPDRDLGNASIGWDIAAMETPTSATDATPYYFRQPALVYELGVPATITIDVSSGVQTQSQAGHSLFSGVHPFEKKGAGTLVIDRANTLSAGMTIREGAVTLAHPRGLEHSSVTPIAGGIMTVAPHQTTVVGGLDPTAGGLVDVGSGRVTVSEGLSAVRLLSAILSGRGEGPWNGTSGITSSIAAAEVAQGEDRSIGWLDNGDGSVTFAYAAPGDANLDWSIDLLDFSDYLASATYDSLKFAGWSGGDYTYDGFVDATDVALALGTGLFDRGSYAPLSLPSGAAVAVPEPSSLGLLAGVVVAAMAARRGFRPKEGG